MRIKYRRLNSGLIAIAICAAGLLVTGTTPSQASPTIRSTKAASIVLKSLPVKSEKRSGYDRSLFRHWVDADGDGCDTRAEVLLQESKARTATSSGCRITKGRWVSAFDGVKTKDPSSFDVDHMVPLAEAWDSGARKWNPETRQAFANDLGYAGSLIAVSASSNRSKGDRDPAEWLPPSESYRCDYVTTWIAVKYRWSLSIDKTEKRALQRVVKSCGNPRITLPAKASVSTGSGGGSSGGGGSDSGGTDPRFPTCTAAKAAGYGPYYRGKDPEYYWYRDADSDGIVCE